MASYDIIVLGAGVVGCSIAYHAVRLGAKRVLVLDRGGIAEGTTAQSSGIVRTHYSVRENVELAQRSYPAFRDLSAYLDDPEASSGFNRCGYLAVAGDDARGAALRAALVQQRAMGSDAGEIDAAQARELLPLLDTSGLAVFGYEPEAGYADPYLVTSGFARAARRHGVELRTGVPALALTLRGQRVTGVRTAQGEIHAATVIVAMNVWSAPLLAPLGVAVPLTAERHEVLALEGPRPYLPTYPVLKDMASPLMFYGRCYGRSRMLASKGLAGTAADPDERQADVPLDRVAELGEQVADRLPSFAEAGLAASWTGLYDVTPDWNPVLGPVAGWSGLMNAFGFSGHGFKLSPMVGLVLAQAALGLSTDLPLAPYRLERFAQGQPLTGRYGPGAVS